MSDSAGNVLMQSDVLPKESTSMSAAGTVQMIDDEWCITYFYFGGGSEVWLADADLNLHGSFALSSDICTGYRRDDGTIILVCADDTTYRYDLETDRIEEVVLYEKTNTFQRAETVLYAENGVYLIDREGITVQRDGEEIFLCDFADSYYTADQFGFIDALPGDKFLVWYTDDFSGEEYPAIFAPAEEARVARTVLRAVSVGNSLNHTATLDDHEAVLDSVAYFNRTNKDYVIELTDCDAMAQYADDGSYLSANTSDRASTLFEQELLNGAAFDIYLIGQNYGNRKNLEEKGLFADLSSVADKAKLIACVRDALDGGGEITAIPFSVELSTLVTTTDTLAVGEAFTYEKLYEIMDGLGEGESLFESFVREKMLDIALYDFVDTENKTCSYDSEEFIRLMEFMQDFKNSVPQNLLIENVSRYFSNAYGVLNIGGSSLSMYGDVITPFAEGKIKFLEVSITQPETLPMLYYLFDKIGKDYNLCGYPSADGGSIHMETGMLMSVGKNSENIAGAQAYLSMMLSETVQTVAAETAFPVIGAAVENRIGWGHQYYSVHSSVDDTSPYVWKTTLSAFFVRYSVSPLPAQSAINYDADITVLKPEHDALLSYVCDSKMRGAGDTVIRGIIEEELSYAESGVRTVDEAAKMIQSRVFIYINE
ncbi:MAG: extracellular solute-binding protein [Clostridia bacterium]|nr:extracellular solute-binding protein [Clostridia bacterium]